jgi:phosphoribosylglycinamide formyltransferase-1
MTRQSTERFVGEAIEPVASTFDAARMASAEPGLPGEFVWQGETFAVAAVLRTWRDTGPCRHGSGERYVRKQWFEVVTRDGAVMKIYCDRQARGGRRAARWWLFSVSGEG